jgi:hypothetical protein
MKMLFSRKYYYVARIRHRIDMAESGGYTLFLSQTINLKATLLQATTQGYTSPLIVLPETE